MTPFEKDTVELLHSQILDCGEFFKLAHESETTYQRCYSSVESIFYNLSIAQSTDHMVNLKIVHLANLKALTSFIGNEYDTKHDKPLQERIEWWTLEYHEATATLN
jgi:hypothetical protein